MMGGQSPEPFRIDTLGSRYIVHPFFGIDFGTGEVIGTTAPWRVFARD